MKYNLLLFFVVNINYCFCQETTSDKIKPILLSYLKTVPQLKGSEIINVDISNVSIISEKEKNTRFFNFYNSFRLNQLEQIGLIKLSAQSILLGLKYNDLTRKDYKKEVENIKEVMRETVPLIDSLWTLEEKYKNIQSSGNSQEYYFVTFSFNTLVSGTKFAHDDYKMILSKDLKVLLYDFVN